MKEIVYDKRLSTGNFRSHSNSANRVDKDEVSYTCKGRRSNFWVSNGPVYCTRNNYKEGFAYTSHMQELFELDSGNVINRLNFLSRVTIKFRDNGLYIYQFFKRRNKKKLSMMQVPYPSFVYFPDDVKNRVFSDVETWANKKYNLDINNIYWSFSSLVEFRENVFLYIAFPLLRPAIENGHSLSSSITTLDKYAPLRRSTPREACAEYFGKRMVSKPVVRQFAKCLYDADIYPIVYMRSLRRHVDYEILDYDLFKDIFLSNYCNTILDTRGLGQKHKGNLNVDKHVKGFLNFFLGSLSRTKRRQVLLSDSVSLSVLYDTARMFYQYVSTYGDYSKLIRGSKTIYEIHQNVSHELRKLRFKNMPIPRDKYSNFENITTENCRLVIPEDTNELSDWSSPEKLNNCIHNYRDIAASGNMLFIGVESQNELIGAMAIDRESKVIWQVEGKSNAPLPDHIQREVLYELYNRGVNAKGPIWNGY